jgi:O-antigen ligase
MHSNVIQLAVDTGVLGLSAWLGIWICFFRIMYKRSKSLGSDQSSKWVVAGSSATVIAFLAGGCFESNFYDSEVNMLLWFIMALPFTGSKINKIAEGNTVIKKIN